MSPYNSTKKKKQKIFTINTKKQYPKRSLLNLKQKTHIKKKKFKENFKKKNNIYNNREKKGNKKRKKGGGGGE